MKKSDKPNPSDSSSLSKHIAAAKAYPFIARYIEITIILSFASLLFLITASIAIPILIKFAKYFEIFSIHSVKSFFQIFQSDLVYYLMAILSILLLFCYNTCLFLNDYYQAKKEK